MKIIHIKLLVSIFIFILILTVQFGWLDKQGRDYTEQGLKRTLVTYALARGLNGVISVAQGTEIAVQPVGVGLTFTPGQILDPVNDLIERFSWVVLVSGTSLGIQRMMIEITSWYWFSLLCTLMLLVSLIMLWIDKTDTTLRARMLYKIAAILIVIRFTIPVIAVINEGIYIAFLQPQYEESKLQLEQTTGEVDQLKRDEDSLNAGESTFMGKMQAIYSSASNAVDIESQLQSLKNKVDELSQYALNLIVVFVLQTLIFPIIFLFISYKSILKLFRL